MSQEEHKMGQSDIQEGQDKESVDQPLVEFAPKEPPSSRCIEEFERHPWVIMKMTKYQRETCIIADQAAQTISEDLLDINDEYKRRQGGPVLFTAVTVRVKKPDSYLRKLFRLYSRSRKKKGAMTKENFEVCAKQIHDILGARFATPYYDQVIPAVRMVQENLKERNYEIDLIHTSLPEKDYLDLGDQDGYRSYHFFVEVPTVVDIFGKTKHFRCEIQARTELQHVWAVKSRDLFYNSEIDWEGLDDQVKEDMKQVSNLLRSADAYLVSIRKRADGIRNRTQEGSN